MRFTNYSKITTTVIFSLCLSILTLFVSDAKAIEIGETAPDLPESAVVRLELEKYKKNVIYLDFWAAWCGSCQLSLPWMNEINSKYNQSNLRVIAVNLDKKREDAERLLNEINADYIIKFDPDGSLAQLYNLSTMPSSYLIDANGKIIAVYKGFGDKHKQKIEADIRQAITGDKNEIP